MRNRHPAPPQGTKKAAPRLILAALFIGLVVAFFKLGLSRFLTLEQLQLERERFAQGYAESPGVYILGFVAVYVLIAALSLPGATILTLAGGALFGLPLGLVLVSVASTVGATLAFLASRFLLRDFVIRRFGDRARRMDEGVRKEGAFYLLTLRLVPLFPFFLVNLVMGLTSLPARTFFWVSQVGMLPGTIAYVNAGTQLGQLTSLRGILSPGILLSFAVVGLLPLILKRAIGGWKDRGKRKRFARPSRYDYNVVVIGAGSAGLVSAYLVSALKAKVALIERYKMGGDCLNTGCVPSKALIRAARTMSEIAHAGELGIRDARGTVDFAAVMERIQRVIREVEPHDSVERYTSLGVECISGEARIRTPYEVEVDGRKLTTRNIIIATGASPYVPPIPGLRETRHWTSDTLWSLRELPRRLLILGGGPIGCELAQAFQRLGSQVTIVERTQRLLGREDEDVATLIAARLRSEGVSLHLGEEARSISTAPSGARVVTCSSGAQVEFDEVIVALGRRGSVRGFGLEELGVEISEQGLIAHDEWLRTTYPNIYVCGDVAGPYQFTHAAAHQAGYAALNSLFSPFKKFRADYRVLPWTTFTDPEVARVGLSEADAKDAGIPYEVTRYAIDDLDRAIAEGEAHGFVKVLTEPGKDRILGATIVGAHAGDTITELVLAMKHGIGLGKILNTIHTYPTFAESNRYVAGAWKRAHTPASALRVLKRFHEWRRG